MSSETALCVLHELRRGVVPEHFPAWVWKIARNRYSAWAEKRRRTAETVASGDIGDFSVSATAETVSLTDGIIKSEDILALRRELAFISKNHREVLVAYYIDNRSVREIASAQNAAEGTVKARLFRSRKLLKEGIQMAREFGIKSYKPEEVNFAASGSQPVGLPWKAVQRKIPKNILLHADNNPSSEEELAIELGVALPYMEEEIELLLDATLLKKTDNGKYITNFFIASADCQTEIYNASRRDSKERSEILHTLVGGILPELKKLNLMRNAMPDSEFKWLLMIYAHDHAIYGVDGYDIENRVDRKDSGSWGFMGKEICILPESLVMGHNGNGDVNNVIFWAYKISDYGMWDRAGEMGYTGANLLADIVRNNRKLTSLSPAEYNTWQQIENRFAHAENDEIIPDIAVFENKNTADKFNSLITGHKLFGVLTEKYQELFDTILEILRKHANPVLIEQPNYYASMSILDTRMMMVHDAVEAGWLTVPAEPDKSTAAMWLAIR